MADISDRTTSLDGPSEGSTQHRIPVLYLAPWVDCGAADANTLDWFSWLDRSRFAASLITTQPSPNRRLFEAVLFAEEIWALPDLMEGKDFPQFIAEFLVTREIQLIHLMNSRMGFDLLPDFRALRMAPKIVVQLHVEEPTHDCYVRYVTTRYGNLVDAYSVSSSDIGEAVVGYGVPRERVAVIPTGIDSEQLSRDRIDPTPGPKERVTRRFSEQDMAAHHAELYGRLLPDSRTRLPNDSSALASLPVGPRFASRPSRGTPRVSVVVPCFNHGRLLRECIDSIRGQTYPNVELIVVDDCSTDIETRSYLRELSSDKNLTVIRLSCNRGPSVARNSGISRVTGRYILPLDSDNLLLPDAIERLVVQLQGAGEHIGFIYQNLQYIGNREDYFEPPVYNAWLLTSQNYIDTCALIDRDVFDLGLAYAEDIVFGHEDWDFFLQLAERGIQGEPARSKTLLYRKEGFTRSDLVEWTGSSFYAELASRHPRLMSGPDPTDDDFRVNVSLKARWAPGLSIVAIDELELGGSAWESVQARLQAQKFRDFELLVALDGEPDDDLCGPPIRRLPAPRTSSAERLVNALEIARARNVVVTARALPDLLSDPGATERLARLLECAHGDTGHCFIDVHDSGVHPFARVTGDDPDATVHSVAFSVSEAKAWKSPPKLDTGDPIGAFARWMQIERLRVEWRHLVAPSDARPVASGKLHCPLALPPTPRPERWERKLRHAQKPAFSDTGVAVARWQRTPSWLPAYADVLIRHRRLGFEQWTVTMGTPSPEGYNPEHNLGVVHQRALSGTRRIVRDGEHGYAAAPIGGKPSADDMDESFGYVDEAEFSMSEPLLLCRHARAGVPVLICGEDDPLREAVEWPPISVLGYIDRFPVNPRGPLAHSEPTAWLRGLVRTIDSAARRHRVSFGPPRAGRRSWELGALLDRDPGEGIAAWIDDAGRLHTSRYSPARHPYSLGQTLRWVAAPAGWLGFGRGWARSRAIVRRSVEAARHARTRAPIATLAGSEPADVAWLLPAPGPDRHPVFAAVHPVTADQLVTRDRSEARELGYGPAHILGYALALAPVTGTLRRPTVSVPWGSRFGDVLTRCEDPVDD